METKANVYLVAELWQSLEAALRNLSIWNHDPIISKEVTTFGEYINKILHYQGEVPVEGDGGWGQGAVSVSSMQNTSVLTSTPQSAFPVSTSVETAPRSEIAENSPVTSRINSDYLTSTLCVSDRGGGYYSFGGSKGGVSHGPINQNRIEDCTGELIGPLIPDTTFDEEIPHALPHQQSDMYAIASELPVPMRPIFVTNGQFYVSWEDVIRPPTLCINLDRADEMTEDDENEPLLNLQVLQRTINSRPPPSETFVARESSKIATGEKRLFPSRVDGGEVEISRVDSGEISRVDGEVEISRVDSGEISRVDGEVEISRVDSGEISRVDSGEISATNLRNYVKRNILSETVRELGFNARSTPLKESSLLISGRSKNRRKFRRKEKSRLEAISNTGRLLAAFSDEELSPPVDPDVYDVEEIREMMIDYSDRQQKYYLVKWQDYPEEDSTWEPLENLLGDHDGRVQILERVYKTKMLISQRIGDEMSWNWVPGPADLDIAPVIEEFIEIEKDNRINGRRLWFQAALQWTRGKTTK